MWGWPCPPPQSTQDCRYVGSCHHHSKSPFKSPLSNSPLRLRGCCNEAGKGRQQSFWSSRPWGLLLLRWVRRWTDGRRKHVVGGYNPIHPRLVSAITRWSAWPWEAALLDTANRSQARSSARCCILPYRVLHSCPFGRCIVAHWELLKYNRRRRCRLHIYAAGSTRGAHLCQAWPRSNPTYVLCLWNAVFIVMLTENL